MMQKAMKPRVGMLTLGCRVNQYESEAIAEGFTTLGFSLFSFEDSCDIYVINTCAVTKESERKSRQMIRRALRKKEKASREGRSVLVVVCGCYAQQYHQQGYAFPDFEGVSFLSGNVGKDKIASSIARMWEEGLETPINVLQGMAGVAYDPLFIRRSEKVRAFVKIQDGCNSFCTYCIVPYLRGRVRSRKKEEILREVENLVENGAGEIVLTGIETGAYGTEENRRHLPLLELVQAVSRIPGVHRISFGSLKPDVFTESFTEALSRCHGILPHFHLSVQNGSDPVLKAMGRRYTIGQVNEILARIRTYFPRVTFSADMIVGFPGETEEDFQNTLHFIKEAGFLHVHIFPYSQREGTAAAKYAHQIAPIIKKQRAAMLAEEAKRAARGIKHTFEGQSFSLLIESMDPTHVVGHTENNLEMKIPRHPEDRGGGMRTVNYTHQNR